MIDAAELLDVRLSADGKCLRLRLRDRKGQTVALSLPAGCLNSLLRAIPEQSFSGTIHPLDSWNLERPDAGQDLVLTLRTPEGQAVCFALKPWQIDGMATIAAYGRAGQAPGPKLH
ncbi:hypothetical protein [Rhodopila globiformis]|uniref:Uncharacterized protein n=1 Tax=Rhodopila globiformis TaxID=1071 RepID=A0A2S6MXJ9_RHOGL|nr:hypothetical protein [Rhodopila globiformis]PPQ27069.1 hypothetical protein CCS01_28455 [Rhodopila globiformis]